MTGAAFARRGFWRGYFSPRSALSCTVFAPQRQEKEVDAQRLSAAEQHGNTYLAHVLYRIHLQRALTIPGQEHGATTSGLHDASSPFQTRHGTFPARRLLQGLCTKVASPTAQLYSCPVGPMVQNMMPRTATEKLRARPWLSRFGCWLRRRNTAIAREEGVYLVVAH